MDFITDLLGFDLMSFFGNIFMVLILILIIGVVLGRQLFNIKGLAIISIIVIFVLGGGTVYRYLNTFKGPGISFYKGNDNIGNIVDDIDSNVSERSLKNYNINDDAISMKLIGIKKGTLIQFFDDPNGSLNDDWAEIFVKKDIDERIISSFQSTITKNDEIAMYYSKHNGLDGKVSKVVITHNVSKPSSSISFYEGNSLDKDKICEVLLNGNLSINFTNTNNSYGCSNDEVRSARLRNIPPNTRIRIFDSPEGSLTDDWLDILTLEAIDTLKLSTFELTEDVKDEKYIMQYHNKDGLDGKVSRIEITQATSLDPLAVFYKDKDGKGDIVKVINLSKTSNEKFDGKGENDAAKSAILYNIPANKRLSVFDDPNGINLNDDWAEIFVKKTITKEIIDTFEQNKNSKNYEMYFYPKDNLDGKISYVRVANAKTFSSFIELLRVDKNKKDVICRLSRLSANSDGEINLKKESHCKNDHANSMRLYNVPKNTYISVYDDPNCNGEKDDWTEIYVKKDTKFLQINTFQQNISNKSNYSVKYHKDNGLNGKVSGIKFGK